MLILTYHKTIQELLIRHYLLERFLPLWQQAEPNPASGQSHSCLSKMRSRRPKPNQTMFRTRCSSLRVLASRAASTKSAGRTTLCIPCGVSISNLQLSVLAFQVTLARRYPVPSSTKIFSTCSPRSRPRLLQRSSPSRYSSLLCRNCSSESPSAPAMLFSVSERFRTSGFENPDGTFT